MPKKSVPACTKVSLESLCRSNLFLFKRHSEIAIKGLSMGADVVVEKPFMKRENLLGSTVLVSINRIISLSFGYTRDMIWAWVFGSSLAFDAFVIAFHLPSFFSYIVSEAGIKQVFIPLLSEKQIQSHDADVRNFISDMSVIL